MYERIQEFSKTDVTTSFLLANIQGNLVERKAYLTFPEQGQITLLHLACIEGDLRAVEMMLSSGFDPNAELADGKTPFFYAIQPGHILIAKLLIEYGVNCHAAFTINGYETDFFGNIKSTKKNSFPVHIAAAMNQCDMLKLLCKEYCANADYLLEDGRSCLYLACAAGFAFSYG